MTQCVPVFIKSLGFPCSIVLVYARVIVLAQIVGNKLIVRTVLNYLTIIEHGGFIAEAARGLTVANIDGCLVTNDLVKLGYISYSTMGYGGRRLIKNDK